jgi:hypothetical protein
MQEQNNENKPIEGEDFYYTPEGYKCFTVALPPQTRLLLPQQVAGIALRIR